MHFMKLETVCAAAAFALCAIVSSSSAFGDEPCDGYWDTTIGQPGIGIDGNATTAVVFDDGTGPTLYAAGNFSSDAGISELHVARWDGQKWSPIGGSMDGTVWSLAVFDDGAGPALYAAGDFGISGGVQTNGVAKWDGEAWQPLGIGVAGGGVLSMAVFDDGTGPALYVAGTITEAGGQPTTSIAAWDGQAWTTFDIEFDNLDRIDTLCVHDEGSGAALYIGGVLVIGNEKGIAYLARWDGSTWSAVGDPSVSSWVYALVSVHAGDDHLDGLYAGGSFHQAGTQTARKIAKWDGKDWSPLGTSENPGTNLTVRTLAFLSDENGPSVYLGGNFTEAGDTPAQKIARWDGAAFSALGSGLEHSPHDLVAYEDDIGPALIVCGVSSAGGQAVNGIAMWRPGKSAPGDLNCDGVVDGADLAALLGDWGPCTDCDACPADLDGDCTVDGADLAIMLGNWS